VRFRPRTVRARLALSLAATLAVLLAAFSVSVYATARANLLGQVETRAREDLALVAHEVAEGPLEVSQMEDIGLVALYAVAVGDEPVNASSGWVKRGLPMSLPLANDPETKRWKSAEGLTYTCATTSLDIRGERVSIAVAQDERHVQKSLATLATILLVGSPIAILAAFLGASVLARRLLAPVGAMAEAAARITEEKLSARLPVEDETDEFGRLAIAFNRTFARIESAFEKTRRFTSDASHELRTPLTALRSVGEVALRDGADANACREAIASMLEESDRLARLVDGLLVLSREDANAYRARFAEVDLCQPASEVVDVLRVLADERGQKIETEIRPGLFVQGDPTILRQAVFNLVDNAIKYTPEGGTIRVGVRADGAGEALLEVADSGPGIAPEHREKIFERFYRIDADRSRASGGSGLGLSIARWAVGLHGGRIELETTEGKGSAFRVHLPRARAAT
jgi:heavy metal sensor kinase